jgi:hypothetical protein
MLLIGTIPKVDVEPVGLPQQNCSRTKQAMASPKWVRAQKHVIAFCRVYDSQSAPTGSATSGAFNRL